MVWRRSSTIRIAMVGATLYDGATAAASGVTSATSYASARSWAAR